MRTLLIPAGLLLWFAGLTAQEPLWQAEIRRHFSEVCQVEPEQVILEIRKAPLFAAAGDSAPLIEEAGRKHRLGYQTIWLKWFNKEQLLRRETLSIYVAIRKTVAVATEPIARFQAVQPGQIRFEEQQIDQDWEDYISAADELEGLETQRTVAAGEVLKRHYFAAPPLIRRGDKVEICLRSGDLLISFSGKAQADGRQGETIRIEYPPTGKKMHGRVTGPGLVVIE